MKIFTFEKNLYILHEQVFVMCKAVVIASRENYYCTVHVLHCIYVEFIYFINMKFQDSNDFL